MTIDRLHQRNYPTVINKRCVTIAYSLRPSTLSFVRRWHVQHTALAAPCLYGVFERFNLQSLQKVRKRVTLVSGKLFADGIRQPSYLSLFSLFLTVDVTRFSYYTMNIRELVIFDTKRTLCRVYNFCIRQRFQVGIQFLLEMLLSLKSKPCT